MGTAEPVAGGVSRDEPRRVPRGVGPGAATTLVGGVWKDPGPRCTVLAPADRRTVGEIGYGDAALACSAADAAEAALPDWADTLPADGHYLAPALFAGVPEEAALVREEVFGPVAAITPFEDEAEAPARAGGGEAGLAAYVHTRDGARIWRQGV